MNKLLLPLIFSFSFLALIGVQSVGASPFQDKKPEKDELEKLILKRIEEKQKEIAEERKKKGLPPVEKKGSTSRKPTSSKANNAVRPGSVSSGIIKPAQSEPKVLEHTKHTTMTDATKPIDPNVRIKFAFADEEWGEVIQFFADEIGYGLFMGQSGPPQGTYTCDEPEMGLLEALDYLNGRLGILDPPHVLIRNGTQLVLVNESGEYPQPLVAIIRPDQLGDYGRYEVVRCVFDLGDLDGNVLASQIRELVDDVHQDGFSYIQAANRMEIRERVMVLREFNELIQEALQKEVSITTLTYEVKHIEPENLLFNLRQMMGIGEDQFQVEDGSLRFSVQPLGNKIFLTGSPKRINEFEKYASLIDVPFDPGESLLDEKPMLKSHPAPGDLEVVFQVVQTLLDGEPNVKLDKDEVNGNIYLYAPKRIHDEITAALNEMAGGVSFSIIPVRSISPSEAVTTVEDLLGIDTLSDNPTGPKLVADSDNDRVMVHGTPQEIVLVKKMIEEIDSETDSTSGPRRPTRFIEASPREIDDVMNYLQIPGIMDTMGRSNRLQLILPKDRDNFRNRNRLKRDIEPNDSDNQNSDGSSNRSGIRTRTQANSERLRTTWRMSAKHQSYYASMSAANQESGQQDDVTEIGQTTNPNTGYRAAQEQPSVPGAPVEVRFTEQGIVINSMDLDAADDVQDRIMNLLDSGSAMELPAFLPVQHRKASEVKAIIEHICGMESSSGGGGGGIGGLIGGAVSNAVGGAAGGALGDLLGGGGGGDLGFGPDSAGAYQLEGEDVRFGIDGRLNYLIVTGATSNDMDFIIDVIKIVDVDSPEVAPLDLGKTYVISVRFRDPMELKSLILEAMPQRFSTTDGGNNAARQQPNAEQQIRQQILQSLQGGGRGRRGGNAAGGNSEAEQPKATLSVDEELSALIVTGPKFIYDAVNDLVAQLDVKSPLRSETIETAVSPLYLAELLQAYAPGKVTINIGDEEEGGNATSSGTSNRGSSGRSNNRSSGSSRSRGGSTNASNVERAMLNAIQRGRGGTGGNRRGGTRFPNAGR